jgi:hypothetical protein
MTTTSSGVYTVGDKIIAYTERQFIVKYDVSPDLRSERQFNLEQPYTVYTSWRYFSFNYILHLLSQRQFVIVRSEKPYFEERNFFIQWCHLDYTDRKFFVQLDIWKRNFIVESLFTNTPLLLKYPKYYNWDYVPQILNLEFNVYSFYDLEEDDITVYINSLTNPEHSIILNSGLDKDKFEIKVISEYPNNKGKIYQIKVYVPIVFDVGEEIQISLVCYDKKGNYLKKGLW